MVYRFDEQLKQGQQREAELDNFFRRWFVVTSATPAQQRDGIDRVFTDKRTGVRCSVEYKADERAGETGNAFIETVSVDRQGKLGWALRSLAQVLVYYVPGKPAAIYMLTMVRLRGQMERWGREYPAAEAQNEGYKTRGVLVPLAELERIAYQVW